VHRHIPIVSTTGTQRHVVDGYCGAFLGVTEASHEAEFAVEAGWLIHVSNGMVVGVAPAQIERRHVVGVHSCCVWVKLYPKSLLNRVLI
jgi:hypothetical protein